MSSLINGTPTYNFPNSVIQEKILSIITEKLKYVVLFFSRNFIFKLFNILYVFRLDKYSSCFIFCVAFFFCDVDQHFFLKKNFIIVHKLRYKKKRLRQAHDI